MVQLHLIKSTPPLGTMEKFENESPFIYGNKKKEHHSRAISRFVLGTGT